MAAVLQPRHDRAGLSDCEQLRGDAGTELSASAAQTFDAGHAPVSLATHLWETRGGPSGAGDGVCFVRTLSESRMLEIGTSGLMSGEGKRARAISARTAPLLDSTLPVFATNRQRNEPILAALRPGAPRDSTNRPP